MGLVNKSKAQSLCVNMAVSSDFYFVLEEKIKAAIKEACVRAKENGRKTVMGRDL